MIKNNIKRIGFIVCWILTTVFFKFSVLAGEVASKTTDATLSNLKIVIIVLFILILSLLIGFFYRIIYGILDSRNKKYRLRRH